LVDYCPLVERPDDADSRSFSIQLQSTYTRGVHEIVLFIKLRNYKESLEESVVLMVSEKDQVYNTLLCFFKGSATVDLRGGIGSFTQKPGHYGFEIICTMVDLTQVLLLVFYE